MQAITYIRGSLYAVSIIGDTGLILYFPLLTVKTLQRLRMSQRGAIKWLQLNGTALSLKASLSECFYHWDSGPYRLCRLQQRNKTCPFFISLHSFVNLLILVVPLFCNSTYGDNSGGTDIIVTSTFPSSRFLVLLDVVRGGHGCMPVFFPFKQTQQGFGLQ